MNREELLTDLGRYLFDYSSIKKSSISTIVLEDIADSFFKREDIQIYSYSYLDDLIVYVAQAPSSMVQYSRWRASFLQHGYTPPLLHFEEPTQKDEI